MILCIRLWSFGTVMYFIYKGRPVTSQQKYLFDLCFIFACRLVLFLHARVVENLEISNQLPDHKRVKKIETYPCSVTQTSEPFQHEI